MIVRPDLIAALWSPWMGREYGLRPSDLQDMSPNQLRALYNDANDLNAARTQPAPG